MRCNRKKLATLIGLDVKTIDVMVSKGMPYVSRPQGSQRAWVFDTVAVLRWMIGDDLDEQMKQARLRLRQAKAGLKWREYGRRLGYLFDIEDMASQFGVGASNLKSRMMAMPQRLAQIVAVESDPAIVERLLQQEVDDALDQLNKEWKARERSFLAAREIVGAPPIRPQTKRRPRR